MYLPHGYDHVMMTGLPTVWTDGKHGKFACFFLSVFTHHPNLHD